ncbi:hypothetical protein QZH41_020793 [Actinostola sp. cb2023]|nr:hypothetical protein QZH41_020793 [Actinostola sp. cb2023]
MLRRFVKFLPELLMGKNKSKGGYYAVRIGRTTGVFQTWDECREAINGVSGARFKKFGSHEEASDFVGGSDNGHSGASSSYSYTPNVPDHDTSPQSSYSRPAKYDSTNNYVHKPRDNFKHTTRRTQYLDQLPSANLSTVTESRGEDQRPIVYSDGCCTNNGYKGAQAGVGVYWGQDHKSNISEKLQGTQTNQRAEIRAACRAIESAKNLGYNSVEVRTDSKYTIHGATDWVKKWKSNGWKTSNNTDVKNVEDFKTLDKLCGQMDVKWTHVPGHSGHHGNEMADTLAKAGARLH